MCGPFYFNLLSEFIADTLCDIFDITVVNYLDDFLVRDCSFEKCQESQTKVIAFLMYLVKKRLQSLSWNG